MTRTDKAGKVLKEPRPPTSVSPQLFTTKAYDKYERSKHENNRLPQAAAGDIIMKDFRGYPLWINEFTTPEDIPTALGHEGQRRITLPWFVGVGDDDETLDCPEFG